MQAIATKRSNDVVTDSSLHGRGRCRNLRFDFDLSCIGHKMQTRLTQGKYKDLALRDSGDSPTMEGR
jgi:hypothetical protein